MGSENFRWRAGGPPPELEEHSKAKLDVLRRYLRAYLERLNINPSRDKFTLDLVDGFAGGGLFRSAGEIVPGTPLIMIEESKRAEEELNRNRSKPLRFDFKYYFVDDRARAKTAVLDGAVNRCTAAVQAPTEAVCSFSRRSTNERRPFSARPHSASADRNNSTYSSY